jgi:pimeloyl-ACP methyl ester carboxylesterase
VHGLVSSVHHWELFTPHFAEHRPVVSWDFRGHGGNPPPRDPRSVTVEHFADDAATVLDAAHRSPAIVAGLSFGVQVALEIWRRHPDAVRALVLICGTPGHPLDRISPSPTLRRAAIGLVRSLASQRAFAGSLLSILHTRSGIRLARELAYLSGGAHRDACPPSVLEGLFRHVGSLDPNVIAGAIESYLAHTADDVLSTITVPTLIIAGDADQLTPVTTAERMQREIAGSELVVFPGHSHLVQVEKPREVHAVIDRFLTDHGL